jgi:hypothetical protein
VIYYEDLALNQRFQTQRYRIEAEETLAFAERYDPIALPEPGISHERGGPAASPWYLGAISSKMFNHWVGVSGLIGAKGARSFTNVEWSFPGQAYPGDSLRLMIIVSQLPQSSHFPKLGFPELEVDVIASGLRQASAWRVLQYKTTISVERRQPLA